jgi:hypothetical protein
MYAESTQFYMNARVLLSLFVLIPFFSPCFAQETPEQIVQRLASLGEGVHEVKTENGKRLKSLKIVGQERISSVLGATKGLQTAQKKATLKANAVFVEWMKNHVSSISSSADETIVTLEGDGQGVKEQGKSSETIRQEIVTKAEGLVRGLTLIAKDQQAELLTLVFSWSPEKAALAADASKVNSREPGAGEGAPRSRAVPKKTVVSPDFDR